MNEALQPLVRAAPWDSRFPRWHPHTVSIVPVSQTKTLKVAWEKATWTEIKCYSVYNIKKQIALNSKVRKTKIKLLNICRLFQTQFFLRLWRPVCVVYLQDARPLRKGLSATVCSSDTAQWVLVTVPITRQHRDNFGQCLQIIGRASASHGQSCCNHFQRTIITRLKVCYKCETKVRCCQTHDRCPRGCFPYREK